MERIFPLIAYELSASVLKCGVTKFSVDSDVYSKTSLEHTHGTVEGSVIIIII